jgi:hypothetical protein
VRWEGLVSGLKHTWGQCIFGIEMGMVERQEMERQLRQTMPYTSNGGKREGKQGERFEIEELEQQA